MLLRFDYPGTSDHMVENFFLTDIVPFSPYPKVDITEQENETVINAELPGVKKEDIKITFENNVLTLAGERKPVELPENAQILLNEVRSRNFNRSIELSHNVDVNKISAEMNNGILKIVLPKAESAKVKTIELK